AVVAERLRGAIDSTTFEFDGNQVHVTVSAGVASYLNGHQKKDLIKKADDNLYRAKNEGKNRIYYDESC
ncbi:MAG: diguanylate cyclase, partial [Syntrophorhabdus sp.]